ncbi:MAG: glycosyltransferase family 1 protein [Citrobacter freundii]|nr:MAG: glycosyltransferase family 1 protein [Citrobacter freundii]
MPKLVRITTAPISLKYLLRKQMSYMQEHGFDVLMVSSDGPELPDVIAYEKCRHIIIPMTRKMTPFTDLKCLWQLYRLFKKEKPDIVHSHTPKAGLLAMLAARMAGVKLRIHTIAGLRFMTVTGKTRKILVAMEKLTMKCATNVWPNSFSLRDYIIEQKLSDTAKLEVIAKGTSNGIDLRRFDPAKLDATKMAEIRQLIRYEADCIYLVNVGRIVRDKGIEELVSVFTKLYETNDRLRLVLVGAFEDEVDPVADYTRNIIHHHPGIILPGWSDSVEYYMSQAFALVHPSHREGFPNVLLQAGAMGCPVICSKIEGNIDIVDHDQTGLIFEMKNEAELEDRLKYALANPDVMKEMAAALQHKVHQFFNQPSVHKAMHDRYLELLAKK